MQEPKLLLQGNTSLPASIKIVSEQKLDNVIGVHATQVPTKE
jgi:hypothetical protein